ncbi:hypothetical protein [Micromonospora sp. NPDC050695]|uniref:hypothetical protein n=1 Tax=Micromonospora sp. NPDC050695 TaxID=3154938 RepID=UPI00340572F4
MPRQPFAHQDASGMAGAGLGIFVNGGFVERVNARTDPYGYDAIARILERAPQPVSAEALIVCINHQTTPAVDCLICDPED